MKPRFAAVICCVVPIFAPLLADAAPEKMACESGGKSIKHELEITVEDGKVTAFEYLGQTLAPGGDTYYLCGFEAKRSSKETEWTDYESSTNIKFKEGMGEEDNAVIEKVKNTYRLTLDMSPSNCGHSSVFAREISITKGKKACHDVETD